MPYVSLVDGHIDTKVNRCVCCGEIIPEGRQVCLNCESEVQEDGKDK